MRSLWKAAESGVIHFGFCFKNMTLDSTWNGNHKGAGNTQSSWPEPPSEVRTDEEMGCPQVWPQIPKWWDDLWDLWWFWERRKCIQKDSRHLIFWLREPCWKYQTVVVWRKQVKIDFEDAGCGRSLSYLQWNCLVGGRKSGDIPFKGCILSCLLPSSHSLKYRWNGESSSSLWSMGLMAKLKRCQRNEL